LGQPKLNPREKLVRRRFLFLSFSDRGYEISPLLINFRKIPAGKNAKNAQKTRKKKSTPSDFWNLTHAKKMAQNGRRRFLFGRFLRWPLRESPNLAYTNNFRDSLRRRYGLEKIYAGHFFRGRLT